MIIPVNIKNASYDIVVERFSLDKIKDLLILDRKVLIVTDSLVPKIYSEKVLSGCKDGTIVTVNSGEESKSIPVYEMLLKKMLEKGFTRKDCVVAVGGGVVGDLAGFVASSYMRGVDFYNIPTTLLSQVDSSIGGKVAVNLGDIKNIVGAFYQPKKVVIDPNVLDTLSERQFLSGLAESVKMAAIYDEDLFKLLEEEDAHQSIETIITRSLEIKKYFVENDEKEANIRKALNFGHTIGHAIESRSGLSKFTHGECVALGMLYMCEKNTSLRIKSLLQKLGLPTTHNCTELYEVCCHDKKSSGNKITIVYVDKIGEYKLLDINHEELNGYINAI